MTTTAPGDDWRRASAGDDQPLQHITLRQRVAALRNVPAALRILVSTSPWLVGMLAISRLLAALVPFATLYISKRIIDGIVNVTERHQTSATGHIWVLVALGFALAAGALGLGRFVDYLEARLGDQFGRALSVRVLEHAASLDLQAFENPTFYDTLERARVQATDRAPLVTALGSGVQRIVGLLSLAVSLAYYSPWLLLLLIATLVPTLVAESQFAVAGYGLAHALTPVRRALDYFVLLGTSRESAKEVRMFGLAPHLRTRYLAASDELVATNRQFMRRRLIVSTLCATIAALGYSGSYALIVWRALEGKISLGTVTFLAGALAAAQADLQTLFSLFSLISQQALYLGDLQALLSMRPRIGSPPTPRRVRRPVERGIQFEEVSFHYEEGTPVLKLVNFTIGPGEHVAIVGENGSGKTSIVKLMVRLYEPTAGRILLDGVDLREYAIDDLRDQIGVIFQDFFRYDLAVRENVGAGRIQLMQDDQALWRALEHGGADALVKSFPDRLEQMLGRRFRHGVDLSGGEWQSVALARAYLRDAQLLVLDEPTAALDPRAEAEVFEGVTSLMRDRMALLISHRFSTVRMAHRILLLHDGRIAEQGTHEQLVATGGEYAALFELQAANYR